MAHQNGYRAQFPDNDDDAGEQIKVTVKSASGRQAKSDEDSGSLRIHHDGDSQWQPEYAPTGGGQGGSAEQANARPVPVSAPAVGGQGGATNTLFETSDGSAFIPKGSGGSEVEYDDKLETFSLEQAVEAIDQGQYGDGQQVDQAQPTNWYAQLSEDQKANYRQFGDVNGPNMGDGGYEGDPVTENFAPGFPMENTGYDGNSGQAVPMAPLTSGDPNVARNPNMQGMPGGMEMPGGPNMPGGPDMSGNVAGQAADNRYGVQMIDPATGAWNGQYVDNDGNTYIPMGGGGGGNGQPGANGAPGGEGPAGMYMDKYGNHYVPVDADGNGQDGNTVYGYDVDPGQAVPSETFGQPQYLTQPNGNQPPMPEQSGPGGIPVW